MRLQRTSLENAFVRLEPLDQVHKSGLRDACAADPQTWLDLYPYSMLGEAFDANWTALMEANAKGRHISFAVIVDGRCQGMSSWLDMSPENRSVEIGATYYAPTLRGGPVNPAAKRLLLGAAFESGAARVQFKVDAVNQRSRAAVLKLGALQEGVLRRDRVTWTGRVRDTVVFSVVADEWPGVRDRLDARLAAFA
jgi:N-acetyltransferase